MTILGIEGPVPTINLHTKSLEPVNIKLCRRVVLELGSMGLNPGPVT